ncbi:MAG: hypothetical protein JWR85_3866 [Marmoricola sp.]|nr:hypothetical protein [Marmoricola sp.]
MTDIRVVPGAGDEETDALVLGDGRSLIYCSRHYISLASIETGSTPYWIRLYVKGRLQAGLPLLVKQGSLGPVVNSLAYYGSNGGIIAATDDPLLLSAVLEAYATFAREINAVASTIITNPLLGDAAFYEDRLAYDFRDERIGQFTVFPEDGSPSALIDMFSDPRPRNLRKAVREGVTVEATQSAEAMDFLYQTHNENLLAIGGIAKRREFFDAIPSSLPQSAWQIYLARIGNEPVAALLVMRFNRTVEYFTPCVVEKHRSSQALSLAIHTAMLDAMRDGYRQWNWGGTWLSQDGVYNFKKKWGATDLPYFYFTRVHDERLLSAPRALLLEEYRGFFVLPFSALKHQAGSTEETT